MIYMHKPVRLGMKIYGKEVLSTHIQADTLEELHNFAASLGLKRSWFHDGSVPHYDLAESKIPEAVKMGAKLLSWDAWRPLAAASIKKRGTERKAARIKERKNGMG